MAGQVGRGPALAAEGRTGPSCILLCEKGLKGRQESRKAGCAVQAVTPERLSGVIAQGTGCAGAGRAITAALSARQGLWGLGWARPRRPQEVQVGMSPGEIGSRRASAPAARSSELLGHSQDSAAPAGRPRLSWGLRPATCQDKRAALPHSGVGLLLARHLVSLLHSPKRLPSPGEQPRSPAGRARGCTRGRREDE